MDFFESDNFNAEEIAEETEHLARTLELIREQIELLENDGFAYRTVDIYDERDVEEYRTDKFRHDGQKQVARILRASLDTPYFARMKLVPLAENTRIDTPSMTRARSLADTGAPLTESETDIYVGANVIFHKDRIIVYSHNSPLGNRIYDRFENGEIECGGYKYKVVFRRKFDIRGGKLEAVFQDYSSATGGVVYDKFLAHMLKVKRGDKRLTDIIPTIQANQNAIITRPADENCVVTGCAGCGKTMIILQRLEYLGFNKKLDLDKAVIISPSRRYIEHIQPVVDDLMINAARRLTMSELYLELILSLRGIKPSARRLLAAAETIGDDGIGEETAKLCYGDGVKRKLITALAPTKKAYSERLSAYRAHIRAYEDEVARARSFGYSGPDKKPTAPVVSVDLNRFPFIPRLGGGNSKCKLYLFLTAYCYILGKPAFDGALFIDEGQDYFPNEYRLLAECTRATVNVYGDENQQITECGVGRFEELDGMWNIEHYALNENYRNAREITEYVNGLLGMNVTSLGLTGGTVRAASLAELKSAVQGGGDDRIAVIYSERDVRTRDALVGIVPAELLYTVRECKGMEYERVFACGEMSNAEKYVAYTRALSELYIVDSSV